MGIFLALGSVGYAVYRYFNKPTLAQAPRPQGSVLNQPVKLTPYFSARLQELVDLSGRPPVPQSYVNPNLPTIGGSATLNPTRPTTNTFLTPQEAYRLIQQGKYNEVRIKHISQRFFWKDVFEGIATHSPVRDGAVKRIPLQTLINASHLALVLDALYNSYGPFSINTWIRMDSSTFHSPQKGMAVDIGAPFSVCKRGGALFNKARKIRSITGVGYPTSSSQNALHIDIGHNVPAGYQYVFIDNGSAAASNNYAGTTERVL